MLQRAAVLIGVKKTGGGLPTLQAVDAGIRQMTNWVSSQPGMMDSGGTLRLTVLTDANRQPVAASAVFDAIKAWVEDGTIEQLLVYFAGHGANVRYSEYW